MVFLLCGAALYAANLAVGLLAKVKGMKFGIAHHVLYGVVFVAAIVAAVFAFEWAILLTLGVLCVFPFAKPHKALHPALGVLGALGYAGAITLALVMPS